MHPTAALSPYLELPDRFARLRDNPHDLVTGNHRIDGVPPRVAGLVDIGVTEPARVDVDQDFVRTPIAMFEGPRCRVGHRIVHCIRLRRYYGFPAWNNRTKPTGEVALPGLDR